MTTEVSREHGINRGADAWPLFQGAEQSAAHPAVSVLSIVARRPADGSHQLDAVAPGLRRLRTGALLLAKRFEDLGQLPLHRLYALAFGDPAASEVRWGAFVPGCMALGYMTARIGGEFDDRCATIDLFGSREAVERLAQAATSSVTPRPE